MMQKWNVNIVEETAASKCLLGKHLKGNGGRRGVSASHD